MTTKKLLAVASLWIALCVWVVPAAWGDDGGHGVRADEIKVMTQNLYVGADLLRIVSAPTPQQIPLAVAETLHIIQQTNFPERATAVAAQIKRAQPDVIGLQEVSLIRTQFPGDFLVGNPQPAQDVLYDYLDILLSALAEEGLHYEVAALVQNADAELPALAGVDAQGNPQFMDVRLTDSDVILVRRGVKTAHPVAENYLVNLQIPLGGMSIEFTRGYTVVDAQVRGRWYRVANTHLELPGPGMLGVVQAMQAQELIGRLKYSLLPVVLAGDFNSAPEDPIDPITGAVPPYLQLAAAGFIDTWLYRAGPASPGYTCCQDELLSNATPALFMRIDHLFVRARGGDRDLLQPGRVHAETVGDEARDKTPSGLWPSDHAGVVARIPLALPVHARDSEHAFSAED
jgi:endonuclease/exonuclease/phosphatase family metal-dependent hydrolase